MADPRPRQNRRHTTAQLPEESDSAYAAFREFCRLGATRSISKLQHTFMALKDDDPSKITTSYATLKRWSQDHIWLERVKIFDKAYQDKIDLKWKARREKIRERDFKQAEKLRDVADSIIAQAPKFIKRKVKVIRDEQGNVIKEVIHEALRFDLVITAINAASNLQRKSAELLGDTKAASSHTTNIALLNNTTNPESRLQLISEMADNELMNLIRQFGLPEPIRNELIAGDQQGIQGDSEGQEEIIFSGNTLIEDDSPLDPGESRQELDSTLGLPDEY